MLNILPLARKNFLRKAYVAKQSRFLAGLAIVVTGLSVGLVLASDWTLQRWLVSTTSSTQSNFISPEERDELKQLITEATLLASQAQPLLKQSTSPVVDIMTIIQSTPDGIQLDTLAVNYLDSTVRLAGTADQRETIIQYQEQLEDLASLNRVNVPLSELSQKANIYFSITATYEAAQL